MYSVNKVIDKTKRIAHITSIVVRPSEIEPRVGDGEISVEVDQHGAARGEYGCTIYISIKATQDRRCRGAPVIHLVYMFINLYFYLFKVDCETSYPNLY